MDHRIQYVTAEESGERIDALLARTLEGCSRSAVQRLLEEERVLLNGKPLRKSAKTKAGDILEVLMPEEAEELPLLAQDLPLDVVFEDEDLIVVNKARGMVVHPAPGHPDGTLVNALLAHCGSSLSGIGGERRPGIVHRIDKDTSGLLIAAKNDFSHQALSAQLSDRSLSRVYEAVARGRFREDSGTVNRPIGRHPTDRKRMAVTAKNSRPAMTHWEVLTRYQDYCHIRCRLETGRTHQIRVHMASIGHPVAGDPVYGRPHKDLPGQCLHAGLLGFVHPITGEHLLFTVPPPAAFTRFLEKLRRQQHETL